MFFNFPSMCLRLSSYALVLVLHQQKSGSFLYIFKGLFSKSSETHFSQNGYEELSHKISKEKSCLVIEISLFKRIM